MSETKTLAEVIYLASAACNDEGVEWENQYGSPRREAEWQAGVVTAHLAAILADPGTVEAVAEATERVYLETFTTGGMDSIDVEYARAAIAVIGARLGCAL